MKKAYKIFCGFVLTGLLLINLPVLAESAQHPNLSGMWFVKGFTRGSSAKPDPALINKLPPGTVMVSDVGAPELSVGDFGNLQLTEQAKKIAMEWDPNKEQSPDTVCIPPSIIYAMQGPFPFEIFQGRDLIVFKLEYYDLVRVIFMDGRDHPGDDWSLSPVGHSVGHWEGDQLVVETTHLSPATLTNNGLYHTENVRVVERFKLSDDGNTLLSTQWFEDPAVLKTPGARFISYGREEGHVYPFECDPSYGEAFENREGK